MNILKRESKFLKERKYLESEIKEELKQLAIVGNEMLIDDRYRKIKELYEKAEKNTIDLLLRYKELDPIKYKSKADEFLIKLEVYRNLIRIPLDLVIEKPKPNLNFMTRFLTSYKKDLTNNTTET